MAEKQRAAAAIVRQQPYVDQLMSSIGARPSTSSRHRRIFMRLKPRSERPPATRSSTTSAKLRRSRVPGVSADPADHPHRRNLTKALYRTTLQATDLKELYQWGRPSFDKMRKAAGLSRTSTRIWQITSAAGDGRHRPGQGLALGVSAEQIEKRALQRLRLAPGLDDLHAHEPVLGHPGARPAYQRDPNELSLLYVRLAVGQLCRSTRWRGSPPPSAR